MSLRKQIQLIMDRLMYNQLYAPDYPSEDRTSLEFEHRQIEDWLACAESLASKREDVGDWIRLGRDSVNFAFERFRLAESVPARKAIEEAIRYLRNSVLERPHAATLIGHADGTVEKI